MSEEEKEAIKEVKSYIEWVKDRGTNADKDIEILLNLIDKLQKENREYKHIFAEMVQTREDNFTSKYKIKERIKELELEGTKQYWTEEVISILENIL